MRRTRERQSCRPARRHDVRRHRAEDHPGHVLSRPRAAIVVTGSELVRGDRQDRNGPFLAAEVVRLGLDPARIAIVGDRVDDLERAFAEGFAADLCLVSGGLGPTHDDRTVELVARVAGRSLILDEELEREIGAISRTIAERLGRSYAEFTPGVRKQATLPEGAISLGLAGTAPGVVLDIGELRRRRPPGPAARAAAPLAACARDRAGASRPGARTGAGASRAALLRHAGVDSRRGSRRRRRRRGRGGRDDLRARVRDPRRSLRRAVRRGAGAGSRPRCGTPLRPTSSARTSARSPRSSSTSVARVGSRSPPPSRAPGAWWRRG